MKKILKEGIIILGVYIIAVLYLFMVSDRIERLEMYEKGEMNEITVNVGE